jgi:DNA primase
MFPILDRRGRVIAFGGRVVQAAPASGQAPP